MRTKNLLIATAIVVLLVIFGVVPTFGQPVVLQFLDVSDWHGQLDPLSVFRVGNVGGAAELSSYWQADRATNPNTLTLTAGDAFGASPPLSSFFEERTTVMAMNLMGFDVDTFGNHNFDRGTAHLQQMIDLATFSYVSANLKNVADNLTGVEPFKIFDVGGVKVAVIGITNPEAPTLVFPGSFGTIEVTDPVAAANLARDQARGIGAQVIVAITHLGVTSFDADGNPAGPLIDFANSLSGFDLIFGDHTDVQYSGVHNGALVVENQSKGRTYAKVQLSFDSGSSSVIDSSAEFVEPFSDAVTPDPAIVQLLEPFRVELAAAFDGVVGVAGGFFQRGGGVERLGEVPIGNLVTDAMRLTYGTQLGFTNGGGIRSPLPSSFAPGDKSLRRTAPGFAQGPPFDLVVGDIFTMLPFGNSVVTRTVTGSQLYLILENGVSRIPGASGRFAQISGFRFVYDSSKEVGSRVVSVTLNDGTPIQPDASTYTLATNDFVNAGGDGYTMLADGEGVTRDLLATVVLEFIKRQRVVVSGSDWITWPSSVILEYLLKQGVILPKVDGRIIDLNRP